MCCDKYSILLLLAVITGLASTSTGSDLRLDTSGAQAAECGVASAEKLDCAPDDREGVTAEECARRGCCYVYVAPAVFNFSNNFYPMLMGEPSCFYPSNFQHGYKQINVSIQNTGVVAYLRRTTPSIFPGDVQLLRLEAVYEKTYRLRVKITDAEHDRREAYYPVIPPVDHPIPEEEADYEFVFEAPDGFCVKRKSTGEVLFHANLQNFIYADQVLQISARLPTSYLYGLGSHRDTFAHNFDFQRINIFAAEYYPEYGSHPFYMMMEDSRSSHGVFLHTNYGMDVWLQPAPMITYRLIGGILDFYFFLGPSPSDVMTQYTEAINRPMLPPYWSLGFHLCRYGYYSIEHLEEVFNRTRAAGVPYDVQWTDIDAMDNYKSFTYDEVNFHGLPEFVDNLHEVGMRYIPMNEPSLSMHEAPGTYAPYDDGVDMDVFTKDFCGEIFAGKVWANESAFVDFTHPNATAYWTKQFQNYHDVLAYDGSWLDMNEPSNFVSGSIYGCPKNSTLEYPPFVPGVTGGVLAHDTLCMTAGQSLDTHYHIHNLYSLFMSTTTYEALSETLPGKRPFIISRGTSAGQGAFTGLWTGDIYSTWEEMQMSLPAILNYNLFGMPFVGADMCGFGGNPSATVPLCQRWAQLASFYPFAINHNNNDNPDKDPVAMGPEVLNATITALNLRYLLLPYIYTTFYEAATTGIPVARPLLMEFPHDRTTYTIGNEYMLVPALLVTPVLQEKTTTIYPYYPSGIWYILPTDERIVSDGNIHELQVPLDTIKLGIRGGYILPTQEPAVTTTLSRVNDFGLLVALSETGEADGYLFWDDGESNASIPEGKHNLIRFKAGVTAVSSRIDNFGYAGEVEMILANITVYGVKSEPENAYENGKPIPFRYNQQKLVLYFENLQLQLKSPFTISWI